MSPVMTGVVVVGAAAAVFGLVWLNHKAGNSASRRGRPDTGGGDAGSGYSSRDNDNDGGDGGDGGGD